MRKLITRSLCLLCGLSIIIMAFCVNSITAEFEKLSLDTFRPSTAIPATIEDIYTADYETNKAYGGDAYTGMQQASAQAANNVLAMEETLLQTNENILAVNKNLQGVSSNLADINHNFISAAKAQQDNLNAVSSIICRCSFFLLLSLGLYITVSSLDPFLDVLEVFLAERKAAALAAAAISEEVSPAEAIDEAGMSAPEETPAE